MPLRFYQQEVQDQIKITKKNGYELMKKVIQGSARLIGSAEKVKM